MLFSMTGYGRAEQTINNKLFLAEVRSLNSKQFDVRMMLHPLLRPYEIEIRNMLAEGLQRGSIECNVSLRQNGSSKAVSINTDLLRAYYNAVKELAGDLQLNTDNILGTLLKLPDVVASSNDVLTDEEWAGFQKMMRECIEVLNTHRKKEGMVTEQDLLLRINNIEQQQAAIATLEPARREKIMEGLKKVLEDNVGRENYDPNRLEQELIYYIEKIDISEEQVRLKNHCEYFRLVLKEPEISKGKKLSFILQEIGREINTTGSKAYDAAVQKCVVLMKDELEKAKEQVLNIL